VCLIWSRLLGCENDVRVQNLQFRVPTLNSSVMEIQNKRKVRIKLLLTEVCFH